MYRSLLTCHFFFILTFFAFGQEPAVEWGKVPMEDLLMTSFPGDSNATAVILYDYGESRLNNDFNIVLTQHLRIKILNEKGYKWGTRTIRLYTEDGEERLDDLEAVTYSLDKNGEIVENELDDDNVFEEEVSDNITEYKFTMPALSPGCVIDIQYKTIQNSIADISDWTFQWEEPVVWSEYKVIMPYNINYVFVLRGYEKWDIIDQTETSQAFMGNAAAYVGSNIVACNQYRWVVKDIPAMRDVPYITTLSDYENKVEAQLSGYAFPGSGLKKVLRDWDSLVKELLKSKSYARAIDVTGDVEDLTAEITKGLTSPKEKLEAIYNWITGSVVWSGAQMVFADNDVNDVLEYKKGNSAEITFLLLSMLKSAGIDGDPIILSTRGNGKFQDLYPIISQFNLTIARVKIGSEVYYIDATDPLRPLDVLPSKILNVRGLVIKEGKLEWVTIASKMGDDLKGVVNINVNEDGTMNADADIRLGVYSSLSAREDLKDESEIDKVKSLFDTESAGLDIDSVIFENKDDINSPLEIRAWFSSQTYIQQGGGMMYLNPLIAGRLKDNPFKAENREFPVDYAFPRSENIVTNINIFASMELKEKYADRSQRLSDLSYKRSSAETETGIQILSKLDINRSEIQPIFYARLKDFYSRLVSYESEMLVIGTKETKDQDNSVGINTEGQ